MIVRGLSDYPEWLSQKVFTGSFGTVCMAYRFPAELRYDNKVYLVRDKAQLVRVLATLQAIFTHHGVHEVRTTVLNKPAWTSKRFEVLVDQKMTFEAEDTPKHCRMRFFVARRGLQPGIYRVQVDELPFAKEITKQRALASLEIEPYLARP